MKIESNKKSEIARKVHSEIERDRYKERERERRRHNGAQRIRNATAIVAYLLGHAIASQRRQSTTNFAVENMKSIAKLREFLSFFYFHFFSWPISVLAKLNNDEMPQEDKLALARANW